MNLYSKKQRWKIVLVLSALVIVGVSLWYSSYVVNQIKKEEKKKVEQWANNIKSDVEMYNLSSETYIQLNASYRQQKSYEQSKIKLWARAMEEVGKDYLDYTFLTEVLQDNSTIPVIILDGKNDLNKAENLDFDKNDIYQHLKAKNIEADSILLMTQAKLAFEDSVKNLTKSWREKYPPIVITTFGEQYSCYYQDSKNQQDLEHKIEQVKNETDSIFNRFNVSLKESNSLFPMVYVDAETDSIIQTNIKEKHLKSEATIKAKLAEMKLENEPIPVKINNETKGHIYYQNSDLLKQLKYFPIIQFGVIGLFLLVSYLLFSTFRRAEQNQVWVGMAKETAHQLGTPLSSLMAWTEILKSQGVDEMAIAEMNKDINRLNTVTDRFSKIGSGGKLTPQNVYQISEDMVNYLRTRVSSKVDLYISGDKNAIAQVNKPLFEWVIENLCKNGIDAMEGKGKLNLNLSSDGSNIHIDVTDTGKGIPAKQFKTVFEPGFTTKTRGWGLGLSLVKRIIEEYHSGKVVVLKSEQNSGTTFRITLLK